MSFFDDSSLAFLPSGAAGKDGKAYSIKPTDGTGDFTFSRGSNLAATRVGADGLIEKGRENLLLQSNQFDTTWLNTSTTETGGQTGYDGSSDAWKIERVGTGGFIYQEISVSGVNTISVYAKAGTLDWMRLRVGGAPKNSRYFDLQNGTIGSDGIAPIDAKIEAVGTDGWYRCSITTNISIDRVYFYPVPNDGDISGTSGSIYIQDAQLEIGLVATDYIESGATTGKAGLLEDEPRFDYSGGATCPSLLLEPSRTNLIPSEYFGVDYALSSTLLIENDAISPEGLQNATKIYPTSSGNYKHIRYNALSPATGLYTFSIFAKAGELDHLVLIDYDGGGVGVDYNLSTGVATDSATTPFDFVDMVDYGNGWYRCIATATDPYFYWILSDNGNVSVTANGTDGLYIWGAQAEEGSYPTSYIPNHSGGSVTRGGDLGTAGDYIGSTITFGPTDDFSIFYDGEIFKKDLMILGGGDSGLNAGRVWIRNTQIRIDGTTPSVSLMADTSVVVDLNTRFKLLVKRNGATIDFFLDGSKLTTTQGDTDATFVINSLLWSFSNAYTAFGKHNQLLVFDSALSDADCITLTTL